MSFYSLRSIKSLYSEGLLRKERSLNRGTNVSNSYPSNMEDKVTGGIMYTRWGGSYYIHQYTLYPQWSIKYRERRL
jgi:hypothetical protein